MLNVFPIQFLAPLAYFILRIGVGFILIKLGVQHVQNRHTLATHFSSTPFSSSIYIILFLGLLEFSVGALFILGLYTQIAALITIALSIKMIRISKHLVTPLIPPRIFWFLLIYVSFSLFITGAGAFAIDLPI